MKKLLKDRKAITLIALVITIVVLIILAAVIISISLGNDGLISRAIKAAKGYQDAQERDKQSINDLYGELVVAADGTISGLTTEKLQEIINESVEDKVAEINQAVDVTSEFTFNSGKIDAGGTKFYKSGNTIVARFASTLYSSIGGWETKNDAHIVVPEKYKPLYGSIDTIVNLSNYGEHVSTLRAFIGTSGTVTDTVIAFRMKKGDSYNLAGGAYSARGSISWIIAEK